MGNSLGTNTGQSVLLKKSQPSSLISLHATIRLLTKCLPLCVLLALCNTSWVHTYIQPHECQGTIQFNWTFLSLKKKENLIWNIPKLEFKTKWEHSTAQSLRICKTHKAKRNYQINLCEPNICFWLKHTSLKRDSTWLGRNWKTSFDELKVE